jgi:glycosyltransferase involved in cell wall biosynthesis
LRIALTHAFCWPEVRRGAERFVPSLGAALERRGHKVVHFSAAWTPSHGVENGVETVRLRRIFKDDYLHEADFGRRLLGHLLAGRFDAIHSLGRHDAVASIRATRLRRGSARTVITDLGLPDRDWWRSQGWRQARAAAKVVKDIDVYTAMSRTAVDHLAASYGRKDGVVVPGGVDLGSFRPAFAREPRPTILFSGAVTEPRKGVDVLLRALPTIATTAPDVILWLSGPGEPEPLLAGVPKSVRDRVKPLGLGERDSQHERYGRAWVTCLPSTSDSFGMALVESLACGTPLVTTTHGAPKELVREGVSGELCEPADPESLARACLRAFALSQRPQTQDACRAAAEPFDWDLGIAPLCERLYLTGR